jgi:hypothetical protein
MKFILGIILSFIFFINLKLYSGVDLNDKNELLANSLTQLKYLENGLKKSNFGENAQSTFPEGFVFINTLYGLSWCEIAKNQKPNSKLFEKAMSEAIYAYKQISSQNAKSTFSKTLPLQYGAFYNSWSSYLLAQIISLQRSSKSIEAIRFQKKCDEINDAFIRSSFTLLESYPNQTWPADNMGMIASLKIHDKIFEKKYTSTIEKLLEKLKENKEFISHSSQKGKTYPRGSSTSLMLIFLPDIDSNLALKVFQNFKRQFLVYRLGQAGIREYPRTETAKSDIDSGPILFDVGFSGTIVSVGAFLKFNENTIARKISNQIETVGFPMSVSGEKKYLFGSIPIADAFILWSRLQTPQKSIQKNINEINPESNLSFHFVSLIFAVLLLLFILKSK